MARVINSKQSADHPAVSPRRRRRPVGDTNGATPELNEDMHKQDLIAVLEHLPLRVTDATCLIRIDREIRNYLVATLRSR
jgi:hypothetical protein